MHPQNWYQGNLIKTEQTDSSNLAISVNTPSSLLLEWLQFLHYVLITSCLLSNLYPLNSASSLEKRRNRKRPNWGVDRYHKNTVSSDIQWHSSRGTCIMMMMKQLDANFPFSSEFPSKWIMWTCSTKCLICRMIFTQDELHMALKDADMSMKFYHTCCDTFGQN